TIQRFPVLPRTPPVRRVALFGTPSRQFLSLLVDSIKRRLVIARRDVLNRVGLDPRKEVRQRLGSIRVDCLQPVADLGSLFRRDESRHTFLAGVATVAIGRRQRGKASS